MISIIHYISAKRRLEEMDKTHAMLDGDVSPMMRAQRDMTKFEVEYYREKMGDFFAYLFLACGIGSLVVFMYFFVTYYFGK